MLKDTSLAQSSKSVIWTLAIETCYERIINYDRIVNYERIVLLMLFPM